MRAKVFLPRTVRSWGWLPAAMFAAAVWSGAKAVTPPGVSAGSAVVEEILDGNQLYIGTHRARLQEKALSPEQLRTESSRGQLRFDTGATGRLNRFSLIRLGSTCFLLSHGEVLISGRQSGCLRSAVLSVRGTHYVMALTASGDADVRVLEGMVLVERLMQGRSVVPLLQLQAGQKARLSPEGMVRAVAPLTRAEVAELLAGPLFQGFSRPLAEQTRLQSALDRQYPGLRLGPKSPPRPARSLDPLLASINAARVAAGRPPLTPLPLELAETNHTYLTPVLDNVLRSNNCDHDLGRWQAVQSDTSRNGSPLLPTSEVIACPRSSSQWNPTAIVNQWLTSPVHTNILLNRPRATHIDCVKLDRNGRSVAICTLWSPTGS